MSNAQVRNVTDSRVYTVEEIKHEMDLRTFILPSTMKVEQLLKEFVEMYASNTELSVKKHPFRLRWTGM